MLELTLRLQVAARLVRSTGHVRPEYLRRLGNAAACILSKRRSVLRTSPFFVQIEPTTACNLECRHCVRTTLEDTRAFLTFEQFVRVLDGLPGLLAINLQGAGEPTLNAHLFRMAAEARRRKIYVFTVSNLNLPERTIRRLADSEFNEINVSLESVDPDEYVWFRPGGDLHLLEHNLRLLGHLRTKRRGAFRVGLWVTLTEATMPSLPKVFEFARSTGAVQRIQCQLLQEKDNYTAHYDDALRTQRIADWAESERKARALVRANSRKYGMRASLIGGRCSWPWTGLFVNANGLLSPCCQIKDYHHPHWGDINGGPMSSDAWHSADWVGLRAGLLSGTPHAACTGCPFLPEGR